MNKLNKIEERFIYKGAIKELKNLKELKIKNALVFTGKKSFEKIKPVFEENINFETFYYNDFSTNPKLEEIEKAVNKINYSFDTIVAIGGGSVIDFAKVFKYKVSSLTPLIAIPTTAGTGSEETQFAVYYNNGIKHSLDDETIQPEIKIVDVNFIVDNPKFLKICTGLDAFCQAIESYFACNSTETSRNFAKISMELSANNLVDYILSNNEEASLNMALASNYAGRAINISRTTAAHAMSYSITTKYGIPHGLAVAINIGKLIDFNANVDETSLNDKRGVLFVKEKIAEIYSILKTNNAEEYFKNLFNKVEIEIPNVKIDYIDPERLKNNPRKGVEKVFMK